jgi:hypothetical protein
MLWLWVGHRCPLIMVEIILKHERIWLVFEDKKQKKRNLHMAHHALPILSAVLALTSSLSLSSFPCQPSSPPPFPCPHPTTLMPSLSCPHSPLLFSHWPMVVVAPCCYCCCYCSLSIAAGGDWLILSIPIHVLILPLLPISTPQAVAHGSGGAVVLWWWWWPSLSLWSSCELKPVNNEDKVR